MCRCEVVGRFATASGLRCSTHRGTDYPQSKPRGLDAPLLGTSSAVERSSSTTARTTDPRAEYIGWRLPHLARLAASIIEDMETNYWGQGHGRAVLYGWNMKDENEQSNAIGSESWRLSMWDSSRLYVPPQPEPTHAARGTLTSTLARSIAAATPSIHQLAGGLLRPGLMRPAYRHHMKRDC